MLQRKYQNRSALNNNYVSIVCCLVCKCSNKNLMVWSSFSACLAEPNEQPTHVKCISHTSLQVSSLAGLESTTVLSDARGFQISMQ